MSCVTEEWQCFAGGGWPVSEQAVERDYWGVAGFDQSDAAVRVASLQLTSLS